MQEKEIQYRKRGKQQNYKKLNGKQHTPLILPVQISVNLDLKPDSIEKLVQKWRLCLF